MNCTCLPFFVNSPSSYCSALLLVEFYWENNKCLVSWTSWKMAILRCLQFLTAGMSCVSIQQWLYKDRLRGAITDLHIKGLSMASIRCSVLWLRFKIFCWIHCLLWWIQSTLDNIKILAEGTCINFPKIIVL